jgi:hypothetical protein
LRQDELELGRRDGKKKDLGVVWNIWTHTRDTVTGLVMEVVGMVEDKT